MLLKTNIFWRAGHDIIGQSSVLARFNEWGSNTSICKGWGPNLSFQRFRSLQQQTKITILDIFPDVKFILSTHFTIQTQDMNSMWKIHFKHCVVKGVETISRLYVIAREILHDISICFIFYIEKFSTQTCFLHRQNLY